MRTAGGALMLVALLLGGCAPPGQRYLEATIERDGQPILRTGFGVSDSLSPAESWPSLDGKQFEPVAEVAPAPDDPLRLVLRGKVSIILRHTGESFGTVEVDDLRLIRDDTSTNLWRLPREEFQRVTPPPQ